MKVAVLIVGEYREFDIAVKSWNFLNNPNLDYYISSWDVSSQDIEFEVKEHFFETRLPNIKYIKLHSHKLRPIFDGTKVDTVLAAQKHWNHLYDKLKSTDIIYDYIFLLRPDIWISSPDDTFLTQTYLQDINENTIYISGGIEDGMLQNDLAFLGKFDVMMEFLDKTKTTRIEHFGLGNLIINHFNYEPLKNFWAFIVRYNVREIALEWLDRRIVQTSNRVWSKFKEELWNKKIK